MSCPDCGAGVRWVAGFSMSSAPWNHPYWSCVACPWRSPEKPS